MKTYMKPTMKFIELRTEESIAGAGSPQAINTSSIREGAPNWPRILPKL